ncbi:MAG: transcription antitermination factor NusB [Corynebacterium glucuronolyticum]|nr:transcription antitermination factor NusB [Corynebacterium glucuronolyticum]
MQEVPDVDVPRLVTLSALGAVFNDGAFGNIALPREITEAGLSGRDAAFATEIGYGTMRMVGVLDEIIGSCSSRPLDELDPIVINALRMGTYQLLYTRVEDHAAVDTSVRLVPQRVKGFVNAILRAIQKKSLDEWIGELAPEGELAHLAFQTGHPEWIARSYRATLSSPSGAAGSTDTVERELAKALEADSTRPIVHLAAKPGEISADELSLITGGEEGRYSPYAVYLEGGNPAHIEPVREKLAFIQDEGSQLIGTALVRVEVADDGGRWLDLCAGPGGKATMIGSLAAIDEATVTAVEVAPHRGELIRKATEGLPVDVVVGDGRTVEVGGDFDRVLVDAPCSGLGSLRRRQESRWTKNEADIEGLTQLQYELLESGISRCKTGGVVVYSTCSPDLRETREIVDKAVENLPVEELDAHPLVSPMDNVGEEKSVQMWTYRHGTDSLFFAVLRKTA